MVVPTSMRRRLLVPGVPSGFLFLLQTIPENPPGLYQLLEGERSRPVIPRPPLSQPFSRLLPRRRGGIGCCMPTAMEGSIAKHSLAILWIRPFVGGYIGRADGLYVDVSFDVPVTSAAVGVVTVDISIHAPMAFRRRTSRRSGYSRASRYRRLQPRLVRSAPLRAVHFATEGLVYSNGKVPIVNGATSWTVLNVLNRGSSITERTGNRVRMLSLLINGGIRFNPFATAPNMMSPNCGPVASVWQHEQNMSLILAYIPSAMPSDGIPPLLDTYYDPNPTTGTVDTWSFPKVTDVPQMRILYRRDYVFTTVPVGAHTAAPFQQNFASPPRHRTVKLKLPLNLMAAYKNVPGATQSADILDGALVLFLLGDYSYAVGSPESWQRPRFIGDIRLAFTNID
uniref:Uncharacterized protein n=1 Tax=Red panda circovirus 4 TaxID=2863953 RepID=A0A8K1M3P8_9CIRC|nr:hypothetical protein [Red panda circovirus 4]